MSMCNNDFTASTNQMHNEAFCRNLFDGESGLQSVAPRRRSIRQLTPLLLQGPDPLLDDSLVGVTLFGQTLSSLEDRLV